MDLVGGIAAYSMEKAQANLQEKVGISVLKKVMEQGEQQMDAMLGLIPSSVDSNVGVKLDTRG